jgi:hypothetical protein
MPHTTTLPSEALSPFWHLLICTRVPLPVCPIKIRHQQDLSDRYGGSVRPVFMTSIAKAMKLSLERDPFKVGAPWVVLALASQLEGLQMLSG